MLLKESDNFTLVTHYLYYWMPVQSVGRDVLPIHDMWIRQYFALTSIIQGAKQEQKRGKGKALFFA